MNYKERYIRTKEELSKLEDKTSNLALLLTDIINEIDEEHPELKESEDERIRKNCIHFLELQKTHHASTVEIDECIAWVEKQGEQKPTDNVVPKFKTGDWITNSKQTWLVDKVKDNFYFVKSIDGGLAVLTFLYAHDNLHLWTIQDAKPGDVLEFGDHGRLVIGIVSHINSITRKLDCVCLLDGDKFRLGNFYALDTVILHPATKEQREVLMSKMYEADYEWDGEKLKLKPTK